jgi:rubrerythrin
MPEQLRTLFEIFKQAIEDERAAQAMYKRALLICEDPFVREILQQIYDDELRHERVLIERYNDLHPLVNEPGES